VEDGDCADHDPNTYPGHNDTKGRWGRNGVDNDCNGVIDG
jgi:serine protease